jgi:transposase
MRRPSNVGCTTLGRELKKNACRRGVAIVFIDEAGFLMAPLRQGSWAPRGHTPRLRQRGRSRRKVSVIGALVNSPRRHRAHGNFGFQPDANCDGDAILAFLKELRRTLRVSLTSVWDRLRAHRFEPVAGWLADHRHDVRAYLLPPYAPELNPVELIWGYGKSHRQANFAPPELHDLVMQTQLAAYAIGEDPMLPCSFIRHFPHSLRFK